MHFISQSCGWVTLPLLGWLQFPAEGGSNLSPEAQSFPIYVCFQLPFLSNLSVSSPKCHSSSHQQGLLSFCSASGGGPRVTWLNPTLGRKPKTLPSKSLSRETDKRQKLVKARGCVVGRENVLREVLCLFLGRNRMSLVRACCSQQRAWPGRDRAGHAWLSSTSCPCRDVLFSWQHLLLLYRARDRDCCFSQGRRCQSLPPSFLTAIYLSALIASQARREDTLQPSPVSRKAGITCFGSTLHRGELKITGCFLHPRFPSRPHV